MRKGQTRGVSPRVHCSWQRANCVHLFPTPRTVASSLLCPDTGPHHPTPIHCSSWPPLTPAQPFHQSRALLLQLNSDHTDPIFMLRSPQQLPTACKLISSSPTSTEDHPRAGTNPSRYQNTSSIWLGLTCCEVSRPSTIVSPVQSHWDVFLPFLPCFFNYWDPVFPLERAPELSAIPRPLCISLWFPLFLSSFFLCLHSILFVYCSLCGFLMERFAFFVMCKHLPLPCNL